MLLAPIALIYILFGLLLVVTLFLTILFYVYSALALMALAKKTGALKAWLAWIPLANIYLTAKIAGLSWKFTASHVLLLLFFTGFLFFYDPLSVPFFIALLSSAVFSNTFFLFLLAALFLLGAPLYLFNPLLFVTDNGGSLYLLIVGIFWLATGVVLLAMHVFMWWKIAEARHKPGWYSLLMLIPVVNLFVLGIIAWKD